MKYIIFLTYFFSGFFAFSQEFYNDARLWLNLYLEKDLNKHFNIHLNQKNRFDNNMSRFELAYADAGLTVKFNKNVKILADYVFAVKQRKSGEPAYRQQFYTAIIFSKTFHRWKFMYRNMFQMQVKNVSTSAEGFLPRYFDRNKITARYEANKRLSFYAAEELYIIINNPQFKGLTRSRSFAGMFIKTSKTQQLELYFCFQAELQKVHWYKQRNRYRNFPLEHNYIYGIGYSIEF
jgi:hypothetical protein